VHLGYIKKVIQVTDSSFELPLSSKIRPSKSLRDLGGLCSTSRQFVFWDTDIDPWLWHGTWSKERERGRRKNSSPLSIMGLLWLLLEKSLVTSKIPMFPPWLCNSRPGLSTHQLSNTEAPSLQLQSWQSCCMGSQTNKYYTYCTVVFPWSLFPSLLWSTLHSEKSVLEWSFTFKIFMFWRKVLQVINQTVTDF